MSLEEKERTRGSSKDKETPRKVCERLLGFFPEVGLKKKLETVVDLARRLGFEERGASFDSGGPCVSYAISRGDIGLSLGAELHNGETEMPETLTLEAWYSIGGIGIRYKATFRRKEGEWRCCETEEVVSFRETSQDEVSVVSFWREEQGKEGIKTTKTRDLPPQPDEVLDYLKQRLQDEQSRE
jgi:hypothetical protein